MKIYRYMVCILAVCILSVFLQPVAYAGYDDVSFSDFSQFTDNTYLLSRLDVALNQYPVGSWFNKIGTGPCKCHGSSSVENHHSNLSNCDCLRYYIHPETGEKIDTGSGQCQAYAYYVFNILFGQNLKGTGSTLMIRDDSVSLTRENMIGLIEAANAGFGAHIRIGSAEGSGSHSVILLGYDEDSITYLNCNLIDATGKQCRIAVTERPWSAFEAQYEKRKGIYIETPTIMEGAKGRNVKLSSATINEGDQELQAGESVKLTCTVKTSSLMKNDGLFEGSWRSSDENVALVDSDGVLTAVGGGEATITVQTKFGVKGSIRVVVQDDREPCYGAVTIMQQTEFCARPADEAGVGEYAQRGDVLNVYAVVTDDHGGQWYALARRGGYYIKAGDADLIMGFTGEPIRIDPVDGSGTTDRLKAKVGEVLHVSPKLNTDITGEGYKFTEMQLSCSNPEVAVVSGTSGGKLTVRGLGETVIDINGYIITPDNERVRWNYAVPLSVDGVAGVSDRKRYEVVYASGLRLREQPTTQSDTTVVMAAGSFFTADMNRTLQAEGYTWAYAEADSGEMGWTVISNSSYCVPVAGYTLVQAGMSDRGHRYIVYQGDATWSEAADYAASLGAGWHLATITDEQEQAYVRRLVTAYGGTCWLGATYSSGWHWTTGEAFEYTNWDDGEPSGNSSEPYLGIYGNSTQTSYATEGKWNDFKAATTTVNGFVAENSDVKTITFPHDAMMIYVGQETYLNVQVEPALGAGESLKYVTDDPDLLSIDSEGRMLAYAAGITTVRAEAPDGTSAELRVYVFDEAPVLVDSDDLTVGIGQQRAVSLKWNESSKLRGHLLDFEISQIYTDVEGVYIGFVDDTAIEGINTGVANLYYDVIYTTTDGYMLYGDTVQTPVAVGDIFAADRERYECAVGDTVKISYEIRADNLAETELYWETERPERVLVDQNGRITACGKGDSVIRVYATWARIPVGSIECSVQEYTTLSLPDNLVLLEKDALRGVGAQRIDARGTGLKRIESGALGDLPNLRSVCLDAQVEYIAPDAFDGSEIFWMACPEGSYAHQWALEHGYCANVW